MRHNDKQCSNCEDWGITIKGLCTSCYNKRYLIKKHDAKTKANRGTKTANALSSK